MFGAKYFPKARKFSSCEVAFLTPLSYAMIRNALGWGTMVFNTLKPRAISRCNWSVSAGTRSNSNVDNPNGLKKETSVNHSIQLFKNVANKGYVKLKLRLNKDFYAYKIQNVVFYDFVVAVLLCILERKRCHWCGNS